MKLELKSGLLIFYFNITWKTKLSIVISDNMNQHVFLVDVLLYFSVLCTSIESLPLWEKKKKLSVLKIQCESQRRIKGDQQFASATSHPVSTRWQPPEGIIAWIQFVNATFKALFHLGLQGWLFRLSWQHEAGATLIGLSPRSHLQQHLYAVNGAAERTPLEEEDQTQRAHASHQTTLSTEKHTLLPPAGILMAVRI